MKIRHSTIIFLALCSVHKASSKTHAPENALNLVDSSSFYFWNSSFAKDHPLALAYCNKKDSYLLSNLSIPFKKSHFDNEPVLSDVHLSKGKEKPLPAEDGDNKISNSNLTSKSQNQSKAHLSSTSTTISAQNNQDEIHANTQNSKHGVLGATTKVPGEKNEDLDSLTSNETSKNNKESSDYIANSNQEIIQDTKLNDEIKHQEKESQGLPSLASDEAAALDLADTVTQKTSESPINDTASLSAQTGDGLSSLALPVSHSDALDLSAEGGSSANLSEVENNALALADEMFSDEINHASKPIPSVAPNTQAKRNFSLTSDLKYTHERQNDTLKGALNLSWQHQFNGKVKVLLRNRLSTDIAKRTNNRETTNYLQEMYVSTKVTDSIIIDAGRINNRKGIAIGYNPNDYLAVQQSNQSVSFDPEVSRKARLGNISLNLSKFWDKSALNLIISPKLSDVGKDNSANLQLANSNPDLRFVLSLHLEYITNLSTEILTYLSKEDHPQFGFNLSFPIKDDIVAYSEVSTGNKESTYNVLLNKDKTDWHTQFVVGAKWTPLDDFTVTGEFLYDDSGLNRDEIQMLQKIDPAGYEKLRKYKLINQQLFGKYATFARIDWNNFIMENLKLSAFNMYDIKDDSFVNWFELRYRYKDFDFAVQYFDPHQQSVTNQKDDHIISTEINYYY